MTEIKGNEYTIFYDPSINTVRIQGVLRLRGITEYNHIIKLLNDVAAENPEVITLDLQDLQFLNSSGINVLFKFVTRVRDHTSSKLIVRGSSQVPWHQKSLRNLQQLMMDIKLEWV